MTARADRRILLADDEPALRFIVAQALSKLGAEVRIAEDGQEAYEVAQGWRPHLVVADYQMPRLDGLGLARALHADPSLSLTPVLMLTARSHKLTPSDLGHTRIAGVLAKPFSARDLQAQAGELLDASPVDLDLAG
ncbi:MAG: response regulator [Planctomycetota bacterium]